MNSKVLVLNNGWVPIDASPIKDVMVLLFRETAKIVCPESYMLFDIHQWVDKSIEEPRSENIIITPRVALHKPEIVLLSNYKGVPKREVTFTRRNLCRRDNFTCQYCGTKAYKNSTIDHILPSSRGGRNDWNNCVIACEPCNSRKAARTPQEAGMKLLSVPKRPKWRPMMDITRDASIPESWKRFLSK